MQLKRKELIVELVADEEEAGRRKDQTVVNLIARRVEEQCERKKRRRKGVLYVWLLGRFSKHKLRVRGR